MTSFSPNATGAGNGRPCSDQCPTLALRTALAGIAVLLTACTPAVPTHLAAPADLNQPAANLTASELFRGARADAVVEPKGWGELNQAVTPKTRDSHGK